MLRTNCIIFSTTDMKWKRHVSLSKSSQNCLLNISQHFAQKKIKGSLLYKKKINSLNRVVSLHSKLSKDYSAHWRRKLRREQKIVKGAEDKKTLSAGKRICPR